MLKKTITYRDYENEEQTEDFYFNLSKTEVLGLEVLLPGGIIGHLEKIVQTKNVKEIFALVKQIVLLSYGEKDPTNRKFVKSEEISIEFSQTLAFDDLMMSLVTDAQATADFVNAIIPKTEQPIPTPK